MKVCPFIAGAVILCIALSSEIEAKGKKAKFCKGENGKRYAKGEGYEDKGACKRYTCVKRGKKLKMKETKIPCGGSSTTSTTLPPSPGGYTGTGCPSMRPKNNSPCYGPGRHCEYGRHECCGEVFPDVIMICSGHSTWTTQYVDSLCIIHGDDYPCSSTTSTTSQPSPGSMESMEGKLRDLQTSLEYILKKMTAMQNAFDKHESCLADTTSLECPVAPSGKVSISVLSAAIVTPTVFSCYYTSPEITESGTIDHYAACDVNVGNVMDNTTGRFTVAIPGKYRLTFTTLMAPQERKKVIASMVKTTGGIETYLGRALAQSKIGYEQHQITTTLDIIVELAALDTVHVAILMGGSLSSILEGDYIPQTFFTGEYITA